MAMSASGHTEPKADGGSARIVVRRTAQAGLGWILLAIAGLWLAGPMRGLWTGEAAIVPGLGGSGAWWTGAVGVGLAVIAVHWIVRRRTVVVDRGAVEATCRSLLGRHRWREPLANYRELRARHEEQPHRYGPRRWLVIELWHPEPAKTVELARTRDPRAGAAHAQAWARRLALPVRWQPHAHPARSGHEASDAVGAETAPGQALPAA
jgi:hypothetical protein